MSKIQFLKICFFCILFSSLIIVTVGCGGTPTSEFFPALTSAAATSQSGLSGNPTHIQASSTQTLPPISTTEPQTCLGKSKQNSINIRNGPSGAIIGCCLAEGENVEIQKFDASGEWALIKGIEKPTHQGWVMFKYLTIIGDCALTPAGN